MDGSRFDFLAKAMHEAPSRRRFLGSLAGVAGAVVAGRVGLEDAVAQELGASKFDLTCKNTGVRFFCVNSEPITGCGPGRRGCRCARGRQNNVRVCVEQPEGDCPSGKRVCRRNSQCARGEVCIRVSACCPNNPGRGVCARRCAE